MECRQSSSTFMKIEDLYDHARTQDRGHRAKAASKESGHHESAVFAVPVVLADKTPQLSLPSSLHQLTALRPKARARATAKRGPKAIPATVEDIWQERLGLSLHGG